MIRLVRCEIYKILHKKNIYVLGLLTMLSFVISMFLYKDYSSSELICSEFNRSIIFVMIGIIMISSIIVSDEYNGTYKQLLIKPYKKYKILLSKLLSCFIVFFIMYILYVLLSFVVYGIVGSFSDYMDYIVVNEKNIHVLKYVLITILGGLPEYFIMLAICFFASNLFNSSTSLIIGFFTYFGSAMLNTLIINNSIDFLYYFPSMCWNLNEYIFYGFRYCSLFESLFVDLFVFLIFIILSFVIFCNKDFKNQ